MWQSACLSHNQRLAWKQKYRAMNSDHSDSSLLLVRRNDDHSMMTQSGMIYCGLWSSKEDFPRRLVFVDGRIVVLTQLASRGKNVPLTNVLKSICIPSSIEIISKQLRRLFREVRADLGLDLRIGG
jgi:hypothetical protein